MVALETLPAGVVDVARRLCELPPALVGCAKRAVNDGLDLSVAEGLALETRMVSHGLEGLRA